MVAGGQDEYTIYQVRDPFLQIAMLEFFRILLKDSETIDRNLQNLLESLHTETRVVKNTGNAVLYECAKTILSLKVESRVKASAMEIINRLMTYKDVNILYVSLDLLGCMAQEVKESGKSFENLHLEMVLDSLREKDDSIKSLAMKVLTLIANEQNVESRLVLT